MEEMRASIAYFTNNINILDHAISQTDSELDYQIAYLKSFKLKEQNTLNSLNALFGTVMKP